MTTPKTWEEVVEVMAEGAWNSSAVGPRWAEFGDELRKACMRIEAEHALHALRAAGLAVVPREATEKMIEVSDALEIARAGMQHLWSAALSAGELAPPDKGEG